MSSAAVSLPLRALDGSAHASFLELNNAHAVELSMLTEAEFQTALAKAMFARGYVDPCGFILAYDQTAGIDSVNYAWFKHRFPRFVYIDRVVISSAGRGRGLSRHLYRELFDAAAAAGHTMIGCEVNIDPPNLVSDGFHAALGFVEIGRATLADRGKTVRYLALQLTAPPHADRRCSIPSSG